MIIPDYKIKNIQLNLKIIHPFKSKFIEFKSLILKIIIYQLN